MRSGWCGEEGVVGSRTDCERENAFLVRLGFLPEGSLLWGGISRPTHPFFRNFTTGRCRGGAVGCMEEDAVVEGLSFPEGGGVVRQAWSGGIPGRRIGRRIRRAWNVC